METVQVKETEREVTLRTKADVMVEQAERAVIDGPEAAEKGADLAKWFRVLFKKIEEERTILVKPLNDHVKMINERFKGTTSKLKTGQDIIDRKILTWNKAEQERKEREAAEAKKKAEEEALQRAIELEKEGKAAESASVLAEATSVPIPVSPTGPVRGNYGSVASTRKIWKFEVVNIAEVPVEFLEVVGPKVNAAIKAGTRDIPGLRIFEEDSLTVR